MFDLDAVRRATDPAARRRLAPSTLAIDAYAGVRWAFDVADVDVSGNGAVAWTGIRRSGEQTDTGVFAFVEDVDGSTVLAGFVQGADGVAHRIQRLDGDVYGFYEIDGSKLRGIGDDVEDGDATLPTLPASKAALPGVGDNGALAAASTSDIVDIVIAWTAQVQTANGGNIAMQARAALEVALMNVALTESDAGSRLRLVSSFISNTGDSANVEQALTRLRDRNDGMYDDLTQAMASTGADLAHLLVANGGTTGTCGMAQFPWDTDPWAGVSLMAGSCPKLVVQHEIGHNLGAGHNAENDPISNYARGYWQTGTPEFRTIMSYDAPCKGAPCDEILRFSNPARGWQGVPTGTPTADNARGMRERATEVAGRAAPTWPGVPGLIHYKNYNWDGVADDAQWFGNAGDDVLFCDTSGSGIDLTTVRRGNVFYIRTSSFFTTVVPVAFGNRDDKPICGDWDGDGDDTIGIYRTSTATFYLTNDNLDPASGIDGDSVVWTVTYGNVGDLPVKGRWFGGQQDRVGVWRPSLAGGMFYLSWNNITGAGTYAQFELGNGANRLGDIPLTGDWNADGIDQVAVYRATDSTFYYQGGPPPWGGFAYGKVDDIPGAGRFTYASVGDTFSVSRIKG